ncbi:MAG: nickel-dependent lactate racemase [Candidatus Hinthialibacter antarcticus]|nr:nickel-dependent lactate racemase [Candidatus Hinthialibacter antarcticus]
MKIRLAYGKEGVEVDVPDQNLASVIHMREAAPITDTDAAVCDSLQSPIQSKPLSEIAQGRESAVIVISDITRPVPNKVILPPLLETLEAAGVSREKICILIATGIHRPNLGDELVELVGEDIANHYRVENHYSEDPDANEYIGVVNGDIPVYIDKHYLEADLKILTGLVELHLMAGFSGGRKAVLPGIASLETMKHMHGYRMLQKDEVCNGKLEGNPFHEAAVKVARQAGVDFILNVTLDEHRNVTGVFAGELEAAHEAACAHSAQATMVSIDEPVDIVVTSSGGYPLDKTLYQAIKGFVAALEAVKPGGAIILAAKNEEGCGSREFEDLLRRLQDPMEYYKVVMEPNYVAKDQWMIQELVNGLHRCELLYYTEGISDGDLRDFLVQPIASVQNGLDQALERHGANARVMVIPEGPYVMPKQTQDVKGLYSWQTASA